MNSTTSPYAVAAGANNNGTAGDDGDEDAFGTGAPPPMPPAAGPYSITVPLSNTVDQGDFCGWIDFNNSGTFDNNTTERVCTTYPAGATSVTLTWNKPATTAGANYYMRLRAVGSYYNWYNTDPAIFGVPQLQSVASGTLMSSTGPANTGEVEDWRVLSASTYDFGDAPASYGTAQHSTVTGLNLGSTIDTETAANTSANAMGDDTNVGDDEDALPGVTAAAPITFADNAGTYSTTVQVVNNTGAAATLAGWIDFDRNGTFDADERVVVPLAAGATSATLNFTLPGDTIAGASFARLRILPGTVAAPSPSDAIVGGEAEDYPVTITPHPGISLVKSSTLNDGDGDARADAGETITYSFLVTNTGTSQLNSVTVNDPRVPGVTCPVTTLAPGASTTCTATYTVTQADVDAASGTVVNTATASGTPPGGTPVTTPPSSTTTPTDRRRGIALDKQVNPGADGVATLGETLQYSFVVTNTGTVTLSNLAIADEKVTSGGSTITCPVTTLAPGASTTCTAPYTVTAADMNNATIQNTATANAAGPNGTPISSTPDTASVPTLRTSGITIDKTAALSTDTDTDGLADAGDVITYSFLVTNTGTTNLTGVAVNDPRLSAAGIAVTCPATTLGPAASTTCIASYTVTASDVAAGSVNNTATASGTPPTGVTPPVSPPDDTTVPTDDTAALTLEKTGTLQDLDGDGAGDVGEVIFYSFAVTNAGALTLSNLRVTDSVLDAVDEPVTCPQPTIAPGETVTCEGSYTITQADVDAGQVTNVAQAHGETPDPDGAGPAMPTTVDSNEDTAIVTPMDQTPAIEVQKVADLQDTNGNQLADGNEFIFYYLLVTNTGNVTLTDIAIDDPMLDAANPPATPICPDVALAPGESITCEAGYNVTQADVDSGQVLNTATASGQPPTPPGGATPPPVDSPPSTTITPTNTEPGLELVKDGTATDTDGNGRIEAGDTIAYTFTVTNVGAVTVDGLTVTDPKVGATTCEATTLDTDPDTETPDTTTCTATYTITHADVDAGGVSNVAFAGGTDPTGDPVTSNQDDHFEPTTSVPGISLDKTAVLQNSNGSTNAGGTPTADVGEVISYRFAVTNTGDETLTQIAITDPKVTGAGNSIICPTAPLAPGATATCTASYTVTQADVTAGNVHNDAFATAVALPTGPVTSNNDTTDTPTNQVATLALDKQAALADSNANQLGDVGETINFSFVVRNTGTVPVTTVTINDPMLASVTCPPGTLNPGATTTCTASYVVTQANVDAGSVTNTATATATPPTGMTPPVSPPDTTTTTTNSTPDLTMVKTSAFAAGSDANANGQARVGDVLTYTFTLTNTGTTTLTNPQVQDPKVGAVTCPTGPIAPGASVTCTASYTVTQADITAREVRNTATATATPPSGPDVPSDPSTSVTPVEYVISLSLVKDGALSTDADGDGNADVGDQASYTFTVTNTGTAILATVSIDDPKLEGAGVTITCPPGELLPGASTTCTSTGYTITQADADAGRVLNTAVATGETADPNDDPVDSNPSTDIIPVPGTTSLTLEKLAVLQGGDGDALGNVGEAIAYTFRLTNTGTLTLSNLAVNDPMLAASGDNITCPTTPLAPGQTVECTALYDITQTDVNNGSVNNTATATGQPPTPDGGTVPPPTPSNPDDTTVPMEFEPEATLDKTAILLDTDGDARADVGEQIEYRFAITNTGTVPLTGLTVTDQRLSDAGIVATCPTAPLDPGASTTCIATYTVTQPDIDEAVPASVDTNGDGVPETVLSVVNTAQATGTAPNGTTATTNTDDAAVPIDSTPGLALTKTAVLNDEVLDDNFADVGETVSYTFTLRNTGAVTLTDLVVDDQMLADAGVTATCPAGASLAPGATVDCTATYTVTQADVDRRIITNTATADGTTPTGETVTSPPGEASVVPGFHPDVDLEKSGVLADQDGDGLADTGEEIVYSFLVTNSGNVALDPVQVWDVRLLSAGIDVACPAGPLAPQASVTCEASAGYVVTQTDVDYGPVHNEAFATGQPPTEPGELPPPPVQSNIDAVDIPVDDTAELTLEKTTRFAGTANDTDGDGLADVGETIVYDFTVTNTGGVTISGVGVDDPMLTEAGITPSCPTTVLAPGESTVCTAAYRVTQADADAGAVTNVATATGTPPDPDGPEGRDAPPPVSTPPDDTTTLVDESPALGIAKTSSLNDEDGDALADLGETIEYTITAVNTGTVTLTDVTVSDAMLADAGVTLTCPADTTLAPGESLVCNGTYTVTQADVDAGEVVNEATAVGTPPDSTPDDGVPPEPVPADPDGPDGPAVPGDPVTTVTPADDLPELQIVKTGTLVEGEEPGFANAGETIAYTFDVTNTGAVTLYDVTVEDAMFPAGDITCPDTSAATGTPLAVGATIQCTASHLVTVADLGENSEAGLIRNVATAVGTPPDNDPDDGVTPPPVRSPEDDVEIPLTSTPGMTAIKDGELNDADGDGLGDVGETIDYTYTVTNTGEVTIEDVAVQDQRLAAVGIGITCPVTSLPPYAPGDPGFEVGDNITVCTADAPYVITQADVDAGEVINVATGTGDPNPPGDPITTPPTQDTTPTDKIPTLTLAKTATLTELNGVTDDGLAETGDTIAYSFEVTNAGTTTLSEVSVTDEMLAAAGITITCDALPAGGLAPGDSVTCAASGPYTVTQADVDSGVVDNVATSTGTPIDPPPYDPDGDGPLPPVDPGPADPDGPGPLEPGDPVTSPPAEAEVPTNDASALELVKSATLNDGDEDGLADAGETITYSFAVTNTGSTTVSGITVSDPMLATAGVAPVCDTTTVAPGEVATCTATYTVTQADVNAGQIVNVATADGVGPDPDGPEGPLQPPAVPTEPSETVTPADNTPALSLEKTVTDDDGDGVAALGETLRYTFVLTNTGNVSMTAARVHDPMLEAAGDPVTCPAVQLDPGESVTCTAAYETVVEDIVAGSVTNTATASATPPDGTDPDGPNGPLQPGDDPDGDGPALPGEVASAPDDTMVPTLAEPGMVMQKQVLFTDPNAVVEPPEGEPAPEPPTAEDGAGDLDGDGLADLGETIVFQFVVQNTGNVPLTDVVIDDPMLTAAGVAITCPAEPVQVGGQAYCTSAPYTVTQADLDNGEVANTATASAVPTITDPPTLTTPPSSTETPVDVDPGIELDKTATLNDEVTDDDLAQVGETITFGFVVTNSGTSTLSNVRVMDEMLAALDPAVVPECPVTTLAPGESTTCTATYTVTQADVDAGSVENVATAVGTPAVPVDPDGPDGPLQPGDDPDGPEGPLQPGEVPSDPDTTTTPTDTRPEVTLLKEAALQDGDGDGLADAGETIDYTFTITNSGTTTLYDLAVDDPMLDAAGVVLTCPDTSEATGTAVLVGESVECTASYTVTQADVDAGSVDNVATATGRGPDPDGPGGFPPPETPPSDPSETTTPADDEPGIALEKTGTLVDGDGDGLADVGETIEYGYVVTNTGAVTLTNPTVSDPKLEALGITVTCEPDALAPGASRSCTASAPYTVTQADVDNGMVPNVATPSALGPDPDGDGPEEPPVVPGDPDTSVTPADKTPALELVKEAALQNADGDADTDDVDGDGDTAEGLADAGEQIQFTFTLTNTGTTTLENLRVDDPMLDAAGVAITCPTVPLAPGGFATCTATYTVTQADVDAGSVPNTASALADTPAPTDPDGPEGPLEPGDPVDPDGPEGPLEPIDPADPDGPDGPLEPGDPVESPFDNTETPTDSTPALALEKTGTLDDADGDGLADAGETITYGFVVTNTGAVTLTSPTVTDLELSEGGVTVTCPPDALAPGASVTCTASGPYTVTQADVDAGQVFNEATPSALGPDPDGPEGPLVPPTVPGDPDTWVEPTDRTPAITLEKTSALTGDGDADGEADLGETVTFTFAVENTGTVTLTDLDVNDPMLAAAEIEPVCALTELAPGETTTCAAEYTVTQADVDSGRVFNTATVTGQPPEPVDPDGPEGPLEPPAPIDPDGPDGPLEPGDPVNAPWDDTTLLTDVTPALELVKAAALQDGDGDALADAGEVIDFTFAVANTGTVTLYQIAVDDPMLAGAGVSVTCPAEPLEVGASTTCTASYTVTTADVDAGSVYNVATASGVIPEPVDPDGPEGPLPTPDPVDPDGDGPLVPGDPVPANPDDTVTPTDNTPAITLVKESALTTDTDADGLADVDDQVTYTFTVTNTGVVTLNDVAINDPMLTAAGVTPVCATTTLAVGESTTCTAVYTVVLTDVDAGQVYNTATATGQPPEPVDPDGPDGPLLPPPPYDPDGPEGPLEPGDPVNAPWDDTTLEADASPALELTKAAALQDGDGDALADAGETIDFTFTVTNTGTTTLENVTVDDPKLADAGVTVTCDPATLAPGESVTCTATPYTVTQADVDAGSVYNVATATGVIPAPVDPDGPEGPLPTPDPVDPDGDGPLQPGDPVPSNPDDTVTPVDNTPLLTLVKTSELTGDTDGDGAADLDETVTFSFVVTNTGEVTLDDVAVDDPLLAAAGITPVCAATTLAPGEQTTCTAEYPVTQADVDSGRVFNTAHATGLPPTPVDPDGPDGPLEPPAPIDPDGPDGPLEPGDPVSSPWDDTTLLTDVTPALELVKAAALQDEDDDALGDAGEVVDFTFTVTNTGTVTLDQIAVDDPMLAGAGVAITCPAGPLEVGASVTCTASYTVTAADVDAGSVYNVATASGVIPDPVDPDGPDGPLPTPDPVDPDGDGPLVPGDPVASNDDDTVTPTDNLPAITLVKSSALSGDADGDGAADVGDEVTFTFTVTNSGAVTLDDVAVDDPMLAAAGVTPVCAATTLAVGASTTCTATYLATQADVDSGRVFNTATATGQPPEPVDPDGDGPLLPPPPFDPDGPEGPMEPGDPVNAPWDDTILLTDTSPALELVKEAALVDGDGDTVADAGETIDFTFTVTNTGTTTLENIAVDDPMLAAADVTPVCAPTTLAPAAVATCTASYTVTQADVDAGTVYNVATATGTLPEPVDPDGPGGPLPTPDPVDPDGDGPLQPGDPVPSNPDTTVTPTGTQPGIALVKESELTGDTDGDGTADAGETVTYTFTVTNTGDVTLDDVAVDDPLLAAAGVTPTCAATTLAPDEVTTCTALYTVAQADVDSGRVFNTATATGQPPTPVDPDGPDGPLEPPAPTDPDGPDGPLVPGDPVNAPWDDTTILVDIDPALTLDKSAALQDEDGDQHADAGEVIDFSFTASNTGTVSLENVTVDDPMLAGAGVAIACPPAVVAPGASTTCTASYTVTAQDVENGSIYNVATASGTIPEPVDPDGPEGPLPTPDPIDPDGDGPMEPGDPVVTNADTTVTPADNAPAITLAKTSAISGDADGDGRVDVGDEITFTFTVTNIGPTSLSNVTVTDPMLAFNGITPICAATTLTVGASTTCTATYPATQADVDAGQVRNTAMATGTPPPPVDPDGDGPLLPPEPYDPDGPEGPMEPGDPVNAPWDDTILFAEATPAAELVKDGALVDEDGDGLADAGETVEFTFTVTNTGTTTLEDVRVDDPMLAAAGVGITCSPTTLLPGEESSCEAAPYTVTQADLEAGEIHNVATALGDVPAPYDPDGPGPLLPPPPLDPDGDGPMDPGDPVVTTEADVLLLVDPPDPEPTPSPAPVVHRADPPRVVWMGPLALTGFELAGIAAVSVLLLGGGAILLGVRRRRNGGQV